jgi:hypothetical protein
MVSERRVTLFLRPPRPRSRSRSKDTVARQLVASFGNVIPEVLDDKGQFRPTQVSHELLAKCTGPEISEQADDEARYPNHHCVGT